MRSGGERTPAYLEQVNNHVITSVGRSVRVNVTLMFFLLFCFSFEMASNKRPSTSECSQTKNQRRINVSHPNFREFVVENLTYSESDDSSADEQDEPANSVVYLRIYQRLNFTVVRAKEEQSSCYGIIHAS